MPATNIFNNPGYKYGGVDWSWTSPLAEYNAWKTASANGVNALPEDILNYNYSAMDSWANSNQDWLKSKGYTGPLTGITGTYGEAGSGPVQGPNQQLEEWLANQGYKFATGHNQGAISGAVFDSAGNPIGNIGGGSGTGYDWGWTVPVAMFLGGLGAAELTGGQAAAAPGTAEGGLSSVFNAAADSQAANVGGDAVWGAAGNGMTGATVGGSVPSAVDLGSLGGVMSTGVTTGPGGVGVTTTGTPSIPNTPTPGTAGTGGTPGSGYGTNEGPGIIPGTGTGSGSGIGIPTGLSDLFKSIFTPNVLSGLMGAINGRNQEESWNKMMAELNSMYSVDSPYAQQMKEELARKDAAEGRNSQYGPRAAQLAANLTRDKANTYRDLAQMRSQSNREQDSWVKDLASIVLGTGGDGGAGSIWSKLGPAWDDIWNLIGT